MKLNPFDPELRSALYGRLIEDSFQRVSLGRSLRDGLSSLRDEAAPRLHHSASIPNAKTERLALNLRAYAYAMGAPRKDTDEEVALGAARLILEALEA